VTSISSNTSDPRDHIYGLLGLVNLDIEPGYDKRVTAAQLFLDVARRCIEAGNTQVLSFAGIDTRDDYSDSLSRLPIPSWLPDWRIPDHVLRKLEYPKSNAFPFDGVVRPLLIDQAALRWRGVIWDSISKKEAKSGDTFNEWDLIKQLEFQEFDNWTYPTGIRRAEAYVCLMTSGIHLPEGKLQPGSELFYKYSSVFIINMLQAFRVEVYPAVDAFQLENNFEKYIKMAMSKVTQLMFGAHFPNDVGELSEAQLSYFRSQLLTLPRRSCFHTRKQYIGLGPLGIHEGDLVCVLQGHMVPVILRKVDEHYIYIGECDVIGIIDGEILEAVKKYKAETTDINIR
jgi:hypothetical protein